METQLDTFLACALSRNDAARYLGISAGTFDSLVEQGMMPKARRIGKRKLWSRGELLSAFDALPYDGELVDQKNPWDENST